MFTKQNLWRSFMTGLFFVALTITGAPKAEATLADAHNETNLYMGGIDLQFQIDPFAWNANHHTPGNFSDSLAQVWNDDMNVYTVTSGLAVLNPFGWALGGGIAGAHTNVTNDTDGSRLLELNLWSAIELNGQGANDPFVNDWFGSVAGVALVVSPFGHNFEDNIENMNLDGLTFLEFNKIHRVGPPDYMYTGNPYYYEGSFSVPADTTIILTLVAFAGAAATASPIPEPSTMLLLGSGLVRGFI